MLPPVKIGSVSEPPIVQLVRNSDHAGKTSVGYATRPNAEVSASDGIRSARATVTALLCAVTFSDACRTGARLSAAVSGDCASSVATVPAGAAVESSSDVVSWSESGELEMEQLLETDVRHVAIGASLDQHRHLVVARHLRAQEIELRRVPHLAAELRLRERRVRLRERRRGNGDEPVGELRVVVRLRHVERELRVRGREPNRRAPPAGVRRPVLRSDAAAREEVLREREPEIPLVRGAKAEILQRSEGAAPARRSRARTRAAPSRAFADAMESTAD